MGLVDSTFHLAWGVSEVFWVFNCRNWWSKHNNKSCDSWANSCKLQPAQIGQTVKLSFFAPLRTVCVQALLLLQLLYLLKCCQNLISKENTPYTFQTQDNTTRLDNHFLSGDIDWDFINQSSNQSYQTNQLLIINYN